MRKLTKGLPFSRTILNPSFRASLGFWAQKLHPSLDRRQTFFRAGRLSTISTRLMWLDLSRGEFEPWKKRRSRVGWGSKLFLVAPEFYSIFFGLICTYSIYIVYTYTPRIMGSAMPSWTDSPKGHVRTMIRPCQLEDYFPHRWGSWTAGLN